MHASILGLPEIQIGHTFLLTNSIHAIPTKRYHSKKKSYRILSFWK